MENQFALDWTHTHTDTPNWNHTRTPEGERQKVKNTQSSGTRNTQSMAEGMPPPLSGALTTGRGLSFYLGLLLVKQIAALRVTWCKVNPTIHQSHKTLVNPSTYVIHPWKKKQKHKSIENSLNRVENLGVKVALWNLARGAEMERNENCSFAKHFIVLIQSKTV